MPPLPPGCAGPLSPSAHLLSPAPAGPVLCLSLQWPRLLSLAPAAQAAVVLLQGLQLLLLRSSLSEKVAPSTFLWKDINPNVRNMPSEDETIV